MRNVGAVNSPSAKPQPAATGAGRAGGTAKNPLKSPFGTFTSEGC